MNTPAPQVSPAKVAAPTIQLVPLDQLQPDPHQPRKNFDAGALEELAASIKADGLVQPLVVRPNGKGYYIVAGERRYRAAKAAGLKDVPAIVRTDLRDCDVTTLQLVENVQREDLTPVEQCEAVTKLVNAITFKAAVEKLGKSEAWVSKRVNALKGPDHIVRLLRNDQVRDLEVIGDLAQIHQLDADRAKRFANDCASQARTGTRFTRGDSREWLERTKRNIQWQQEEAERQKREAARAEREARQAKAGKVTPEQVKQRQEDRVKDRRKQLREAAIASMYGSLALKPSLAEKFDAPIRLEYGNDFFNYTGGGRPKSAGACAFRFHGRGDVALLTRIVAGFAKSPMIEVRVPDLTLEQAGRLERALKDVKDIGLDFEVELTGNQLADACKRLAPDKKLPKEIADLLSPPAAPKATAKKKKR